MRWICVRAREVFSSPLCAPCKPGPLTGRGEPRSEMRYIRVGLLLKLYSLAVLRYGRVLWPLKAEQRFL